MDRSSIASGLSNEGGAVRAALQDRLVLVMRDQNLTSGDEVRGTKMFGSPIDQNEKILRVPGHPEVAEPDAVFVG